MRGEIESRDRERERGGGERDRERMEIIKREKRGGAQARQGGRERERGRERVREERIIIIIFISMFSGGSRIHWRGAREGW